MDGARTTITNPVNGTSHTFEFDHSFWSHDPSGGGRGGPTHASQETVFDELGRDLLENAWAGYNVCLVAYGQTGSGKSYSMMGGGGGGGGDHAGVVPRAAREIFDRMRGDDSARVEVTMIEIYNERVKDLLNAGGGGGSTNPFAENGGGGLKIRTHPTRGPYVEGLTPCAARDYDEVVRLMDRGEKARSVASTAMNATSSRAHTIVELRISRADADGSEIRSKVSLVDLAGSERSDATGATGARLKEGAAINKSLSALGNCISALAEKGGGKKLVPYRDSALTLLLKESLGGNAKTVMIAALSPAAVNYEETLSTLRYADRARRIEGTATVNRVKKSVVAAAASEAETLSDELAADAEISPLKTGGPEEDDVARLESALKARREEEEEKRSSWAKKLKNTEEATREVDWEKIRDEETRAAALAVRKAAGVAGAAGARRGPLDDALADAIAMTNDANFLADEFDVGVSFKPALVDAQHSMLRIRAPSSSSSRVGGGEEPTHGLEVAVDVTWHSGRRSTWTTRALETRLKEWRDVYAHWAEGELFTSEASDAIASSAAAEASSEMRKLGTAELLTEPLAYALDTETAFPAIVGPDGERRGTLEVSAVPCARDGEPLGEDAAVDDPNKLLSKPLYFLVRVKAATGLPRTAAGWSDDAPRAAADGARPSTGSVTATMKVRYHAELGAGWGTVHATPPAPVVATHESKGSARFRGFKSAIGLGGGGGGGGVGGASSALRYERTHSCPNVTPAVLESLRKGKITFDVYIQHDGGASMGIGEMSRPGSAVDTGRERRAAREAPPPSLVDEGSVPGLELLLSNLKATPTSGEGTRTIDRIDEVAAELEREIEEDQKRTFRSWSMARKKPTILDDDDDDEEEDDEEEEEKRASDAGGEIRSAAQSDASSASSYETDSQQGARDRSDDDDDYTDASDSDSSYAEDEEDDDGGGGGGGGGDATKRAKGTPGALHGGKVTPAGTPADARAYRDVNAADVNGGVVKLFDDGAAVADDASGFASAMTSPVPAGAAAGASRSAPASPSLFSSPMHKGKVAAIGSPGSGSVTLTAANPLYDAAGEKPSRQPRSSLAPKPRDADGGLPKVVSDAGGG
jgi:hypothetical protein